MTDMDQRFQDEDDPQRQRMDWLDQQAEMMMADQERLDRAVLTRVRRGETSYVDFLYLVGRLNLNLHDMEK
jgi:hypothetical protein